MEGGHRQIQIAIQIVVEQSEAARIHVPKLRAAGLDPFDGQPIIVEKKDILLPGIVVWNHLPRHSRVFSEAQRSEVIRKPGGDEEIVVSVIVGVEE
ncbi:MAG: hypothetical protein WBH85_10040 [Thermoanaerobaculia bacterium]